MSIPDKPATPFALAFADGPKQSTVLAKRLSDPVELADDPSQQQRSVAAKLDRYLVDEGVATLVILDRAARPVAQALFEHRRVSGKARAPYKTFFVNPRGFLGVEQLMQPPSSPDGYHSEAIDRIQRTNMTMLDLEKRKAKYGGEEFSELTMRTSEEIVSELKSEIAKAHIDTSKPVLVFDNCIHTGMSMFPVIDMLGKAGFSTIRVGTVGAHLNETNVIPDFVGVDDTDTAPTCYFWGEETLASKKARGVHSTPASSSQRGPALKAREALDNAFHDAPAPDRSVGGLSVT